MSLLGAALWVVPAHAQSAALLPNAMTQFVDGNGAPYAGGSVYFYVPSTTTPKTTWQDPNETTPNTNPVVLDANGRAIIWGSGLYREVLLDQFGNTIWDQLTYNVPAANAVVVIPSGMVAWFNLPSCPSGWSTANGTGATADVRGRYVRDLDQGTGRDPNVPTLGGSYSAANGPITATTSGTVTGSATGTLTGTASPQAVTGFTAVSGTIAGGTSALPTLTTLSTSVSGTLTVSGTDSGTVACTNCGAQTQVDTVALLACQKN